MSGMVERDKSLRKAFDKIIHYLAEQDCFPPLPSTFVVYAHDTKSNITDELDEEHDVGDEQEKAYAGVVKEIIGWLKDLRTELISDISVLPECSSRANGFAAVSDILENQFCLLPNYTTQLQNSSVGSVGSISSVDKVLLFGSSVLKSYLEQPLTQHYFDEIEAQAKLQDLTVEQSQSAIREIVEKWCLKKDEGFKFHHVLTELKMLQLRHSYENEHEKFNNTIIPIALGGTDMSYISFLRGCDLHLKLGSNPSLEDRHKLVFKILSLLYPQAQLDINAFQDCYTCTREHIDRSPNASADIEIFVGRAIINAINSVIANRSAHNRKGRAVGAASAGSKQVSGLEQIVVRLGGNHRKWDKSVPSRSQGSLEWFFTTGIEAKVYKQWKHSAKSCLYTITGSPGQGKSVLAKSIVEDLQENPDCPENTAVLYFACFGRTLELDTVEAIVKMLCVKLSKLLQAFITRTGPIPNIKPALRLFLEDPSLVEKYTWWKEYMDLFEHLIEAVFTKTAVVYIIIDGLDECAQGGHDREEFLTYFIKKSNDAYANPGKLVKLCMTSRPGPTEIDIEKAFLVTDYKLHLKAHRSDIRLVIESLVISDRWPNFQGFMEDPDNRSHIIQQLENKAGDTFVWIRIIFRMIENERSPCLEWFDELIEGIPAELEEMYSELLARILKDKFGTKLLLLVVYAKKSLTVDDVNAACCIDLAKRNDTIEDMKYRDRHLDKSSVLAYIGTLVDIDNRNQIVFIHQSAKDFFTARNRFESKYPNPELFYFQICCTFLLVQRRIDYEELCRGVNKYYNNWFFKWPFYRYACSNWDLYLGCTEYTSLDIERIPLLRLVLDTRNSQARIWFSARFYSLGQKRLGFSNPINYSPLYVASILQSQVIANCLLHGTNEYDLRITCSSSDRMLGDLIWPGVQCTLSQEATKFMHAISDGTWNNRFFEGLRYSFGRPSKVDGNNGLNLFGHYFSDDGLRTNDYNSLSLFEPYHGYVGLERWSSQSLNYGSASTLPEPRPLRVGGGGGSLRVGASGMPRDSAYVVVPGTQCINEITELCSDTLIALGYVDFEFLLILQGQQAILPAHLDDMFLESGTFRKGHLQRVGNTVQVQTAENMVRRMDLRVGYKLVSELRISDAPFSESRLFEIFDSFGRGIMWGKKCEKHHNRPLFIITPDIVHMTCTRLRSIYNYMFFLNSYGDVNIQSEAAKCLVDHYGLAEAVNILDSRLLQAEGQLAIICGILCRGKKLASRASYNACPGQNIPYEVIPIPKSLYEGLQMTMYRENPLKILLYSSGSLNYLVKRALLTERTQSLHQAILSTWMDLSASSDERTSHLDFEQLQPSRESYYDLQLQNLFKDNISPGSLQLFVDYSGGLINSELLIPEETNSLIVLLWWFVANPYSLSSYRPDNFVAPLYDSGSVDDWRQFLMAAVLRKDESCVKLMSLRLKMIIEQEQDFLPTEVELIATACSKSNFQVLQEYNILAHYSTKNIYMDQSRDYITLPIACLENAIKYGKIEEKGEHLLEYILRQPDYYKKLLKMSDIDKLEIARKGLESEYADYIEAIIVQHQGTGGANIRNEAEEDAIFWNTSEEKSLNSLKRKAGELDELKASDEWEVSE